MTALICGRDFADGKYRIGIGQEHIHLDAHSPLSSTAETIEYISAMSDVRIKTQNTLLTKTIQSDV